MAISLQKRSGTPNPLSSVDIDSNWQTIEAAINALQEETPGSGSVTSFSAGTLSELFTTSVANATSTPALSFSPVSKAQNLVFAAPSSGSGAPTFRALVSGDLPTVPYGKGGLGLTTLGAANTVIKVNTGGTAYESTTIAAGSSKASVSFGAGTIAVDVVEANLTLNSIGGTLSITKGGHGANTRQAGLDNLTDAAGGTTGYVLTRNGSGNAVWSASSGSGITSLNGLTGGTQTLVASTNGLSVSSSGTAHTFAMAAATASVPGAVTTAAQTFAGVKTFNSAPIFAWATADTIPFLSGTGLATDATFSFNKTNEALSVGTVKDLNVVEKTASDTLTYTDNVVISRQAAAAQYTLPAADAAFIGTTFEIFDAEGVANTRNITIRPTGSDTLDGTTSVTTMNVAYSSVKIRLISATEWKIVSAYKMT